eukprot:760518-Hanusia_phi.AAC.2
MNNSGLTPQYGYAETVPVSYNRAALQERNEYNIPIQNNLQPQQAFMADIPLDENSVYPPNQGTWTSHTDPAAGMQTQPSQPALVPHPSYYPACEATYTDSAAPRLTNDPSWGNQQFPIMETYPPSLQSTANFQRPRQAVDASYQQYSDMAEVTSCSFGSTQEYAVVQPHGWQSSNDLMNHGAYQDVPANLQRVPGSGERANAMEGNYFSADFNQSALPPSNPMNSSLSASWSGNQSMFQKAHRYIPPHSLGGGTYDMYAGASNQSDMPGLPVPLQAAAPASYSMQNSYRVAKSSQAPMAAYQSSHLHATNILPSQHSHFAAPSQSQKNRKRKADAEVVPAVQPKKTPARTGSGTQDLSGYQSLPPQNHPLLPQAHLAPRQLNPHPLPASTLPSGQLSVQHPIVPEPTRDVAAVKSEIPQDANTATMCPSRDPAKEGEPGDSEWWTQGSKFLGRRVRRALYDDAGEQKVVSAADGTIVGWLPAEVSDFVSEYFKVPAALWHVKFDSAAVGEEDLEQFEVEDGILSYETDRWAELGEDAEERRRKRDLDFQLHPREHQADEIEELSRGDATGGGEEREVTECPKKPMNAFLLWFLDPSNTMKQSHLGLKHSEIMSLASERWKAMKENDKAVYKKKYSQLMDQWNRDVAVYKKYCAAHGIRPKFQVSADAQERKRDGEGDDDETSTKKSISAYLLWSNHAREEIRKVSKGVGVLRRELFDGDRL